MKECYMRPEAVVVCFTPNKAIAVQSPDWGWEDDVFGDGSTPEARGVDNDAGRSWSNED